MSTPPAPESGPDDTRQRLIDAALKLFAETGYARATTRAIAAQAGVNEVTLFRHFGSKKNLLIACMEAFNAEGFASTFEQKLTGNYPDDILIMARAQADDMANGVEIVRLLMCDASEVPELQEAMTAGAQGNRQILADYFRRQIESGVVRDDLDPVVLARTFDALFSTQILINYALGNGAGPEILADDMLRKMAGVFVRGTQRPV